METQQSTRKTKNPRVFTHSENTRNQHISLSPSNQKWNPPFTQQHQKTSLSPTPHKRPHKRKPTHKVLCLLWPQCNGQILMWKTDVSLWCQNTAGVGRKKARGLAFKPCWVARTNNETIGTQDPTTAPAERGDWSEAPYAPLGTS